MQRGRGGPSPPITGSDSSSARQAPSAREPAPAYEGHASGYDPDAQGYVLERTARPYDPGTHDPDDGKGYGADYPIADTATPDPAPPEMAYAVHTQVCNYVLDQEGICRWIVARQGAVPPQVRQCVGAQFVACLDLTAPGGLVPDLRLGASGLFVRVNEQGRMVLLRTGPIQRVDGGQPAAPAGAPVPAPPAFGDLPAGQGILYGKRGGVPVAGQAPGYSAASHVTTRPAEGVSPSQRLTPAPPSRSRRGS